MSEDDFIPVLGVDELKAGSMKLVNVAGRSILLAKQDDQVFGVSNRCPHMGCSLANGTLKEYMSLAHVTAGALTFAQASIKRLNK